MMVYDTTLNNLFIWTGSAWESVPASGDAGADGAVQYNDNGVVTGATNFTYDKVTGVVSANSLNVISSAIPANGVYLESANVLAFVTAGTAKARVDATGKYLVGTTTAFTPLSGSFEVKIGDSGMQTLTVASLPAATATNIARGGVGGLVYVGAFNGTGQFGAVVLWTASSATVVSVINGTGSVITFGVASGFLQITSSLVLTQVTASCTRI
jgi:hypothetical protein